MGAFHPVLNVVKRINLLELLFDKFISCVERRDIPPTMELFKQRKFSGTRNNSGIIGYHRIIFISEWWFQSETKGDEFVSPKNYSSWLFVGILKMCDVKLNSNLTCNN